MALVNQVDQLTHQVDDATTDQSISAPAKSGAALRGRSGLTFRSGAPSSAPASNPERRSDQRSDPGAQRSDSAPGKKVKLKDLMKIGGFNFVYSLF